MTDVFAVAGFFSWSTLKIIHTLAICPHQQMSSVICETANFTREHLQVNILQRTTTADRHLFNL